MKDKLLELLNERLEKAQDDYETHFGIRHGEPVESDSDDYDNDNYNRFGGNIDDAYNGGWIDGSITSKVVQLKNIIKQIENLE